MLFISVACLAALSGRPTAGAEEEASEYQIKGAFLFKFASFVEWPDGVFADDKSPLVIGILGDDPFGREFDESIKGRTVGGRPVIVKRFRAADAAQAHILFISSSEREQWPAVLEALKDSKTLLVGETEQFCRRGGMIGLVMSGSGVRFGINHDAAKRAGLKISAELLRLARIIRSGD